MADDPRPVSRTALDGRDRLTCPGSLPEHGTVEVYGAEPPGGTPVLSGSPTGRGHPPIMNVRRSAAALAATVVLGAAAPAMAADSPSASPSPALPKGLYGTTDPTYDGVWRQSLALLAQDTV